MTTDLSPSGIQRLLEICDTRISGSDITVSGGIEDLNFIAEARTALPEALRRIAALEEALTAIIDRSNNRELGTGKVPDMREIAIKALAGGNEE